MSRRAAVGCVAALLLGGGAAVAAVEPVPVPVCSGRPATIVGTSVSDVLVGTDGPDVIHGLGGDDTIAAVGDDDVACGGTGRDTVDGTPDGPRLPT